ncbi:hypothetical protein [Nocardioides sp. SYSU D00038]|uniref:hypothetical protein n=1 Tax=Nocardioides sp. SYSU D00038 TaxID=2812554 RepID=UPI001967FC2E|nr:hypothetical protein [Nocardioides sp. SYSU D00038]
MDVHPDRHEVVVPVRRDPRGRSGPTRGQAVGAGWRRTSRGFYVPATVDPSLPEQRIVEAGVLVPAYGGVTGWAALRWSGAAWFDGTRPGGVGPRPVSIAVTHDEIRPQPGVAVSSERLPPHDLTVVDGLPVTTSVRSLTFEMRYAPDDRRAVVAMDMAAHADLVSIDEAGDYTATWLNGWTGVPRCRRALTLADENSWSPRETLFRLHWVLDAELPPPLCNVPIFDRSGQHVGTPDLLDAEAGLVGEYDGRLHLADDRRSQDLDRESRFRSLGLEYVTMVAGDLRDPLATIVPRVVGAHRRARSAAEGARPWTIDPPAWWTPTRTVAQRRALDGAERERLLRRRGG